MSLYVLGDVHGNIDALEQVFSRSPFDPTKDRLVFIGDVCDGHEHTYECIDFLNSIPNKVCLLGNHDLWMQGWVFKGEKPSIWTSQGGDATIRSYTKRGFYPPFGDDIPESHKNYLTRLKVHHVEGHEGRRILFVHGGFHKNRGIELTSPHDMIWNRSFAMKLINGHMAGGCTLTEFDEMYIGHTSTLLADTTEPLHSEDVWLIDTGAGYDGKLTLMRVGDHEYWQSDRFEGGR